MGIRENNSIVEALSIERFKLYCNLNLFTITLCNFRLKLSAVIFFSERLSFGVGRLVGSPVSRSPRRSPSHSPCPDSPRTDLEDEEVDVDVEEVGDEDAGSSPPRSATPPSPPALTRNTPLSNPPRRFVYSPPFNIKQRISE